MSATVNAYVDIIRCALDSQAGDAHGESNLVATGNAFQLKGGTYQMSVIATFTGGSLTLQRLGPDGSTYLTALTAFSANGVANVTLARGTYKVALA
jgi:hypothetical protein